MTDFLKSELKGWKQSEVLWLVVAALTILTLSIYWKDSIVGMIAAVTGVLCVVLTGKGKPSSYIFGFVNVLFYAYISFGAKYYGEVMLNLLYFFPMNFVGWFAWKKHMNNSTGEVEKKKLPPSQLLLVLAGTGALIAVYGLFLKRLGGNLPFIDSMSTIVSIVAQILCVKRYVEQWILWIIVNIVTVIMWVFAFLNGGDHIATLMMWSIYLVNAIIMFIKWNKEASYAL